MLRRLPLLIILLIAPVAVHADASSPVNSQATANPNLQQSDSTTGDGPATLNALQPAGAGASALQSSSSSDTNPLQSMDSTGLSGSTAAAQDLQQTNASSVAKLMVEGEGDQPQQLSSAPDLSWLLYLLLVCLAATAVTAAVWVVQRFRS